MHIKPQKFVTNDYREFDTEEEAIAHEAELVRLGMEQWNFTYLYKRDLKPEYRPTYKQCPSCHGHCQVGGGFGDPDGPRDCSECGGRGDVIDKRPAFVDAPPIPESLKAAMAKTWDEWWSNHGKDSAS